MHASLREELLSSHNNSTNSVTYCAPLSPIVLCPSQLSKITISPRSPSRQNIQTGQSSVAMEYSRKPSTLLPLPGGLHGEFSLPSTVLGYPPAMEDSKKPSFVLPIPSRLHGRGALPSTISGFQPLDPGQVRLINLHSSIPPSSVVSCTLETHSLHCAPPFIALSYVWGNTQNATIELNWQHVRVSSNLEAALRTLSQLESQGGESGPRTNMFWVDALCIDQKDNQEKSTQVQRMADIYAAANHVIAWLGEDTWSTQAAFQALSRGLSQGLDTPNMPPIAGPIADVYKGLLDIQSREYWRRVWILQEFVVARDVSIMCGPGLMSVAELERLDQLCRLSSESTSPYLDRPVARVLKTRRRFHGLQPDRLSLTLEQLLMQNSTAESSDPRDRIYAFLGLAADATDLGIWPLYHRPWAEVFQDVTSTILGRCSLRILSCCSLSDKTVSAGFRLPSWVPNWSVEIPVPLVYPGKVQFSASGSFKTRPEFRESRGYSIMVLRGVWVGEIEETGLPWARREHNSTSHYIAWLENAAKLMRRGQGARFARSGAIWRTPIADTIFDEDNDKNLNPRRSHEADKPRKHWKSMLAPWKGELPLEISSRYRQAMDFRAHNKRIFRMRNKHVGLGPDTCCPRDSVFVLFGAEVPFVLRPDREEPSLWNIVGEAYVHGLMDGELMHGSSAVVDICIC